MKALTYYKSIITTARFDPYYNVYDEDHNIIGREDNEKYMQIEMPVIKALRLMENKQLALPMYLREKTEGTPEQKKAVYVNAKQQMPYAFFTGQEPFRECTDKLLFNYTNLVTMDIDYHGNETIDMKKLREEIFQYDYVLGVYRSQSGKGIWALVAVEDATKIKEYYNNLHDAWFSAMNVEIDISCKNLSRKRYLAYNPDWKKWTKKPDAEITPWNDDSTLTKKDTKWFEPVKKIKASSFNLTKEQQDNAVRKAIEILIPNLKEYKDWELLAERLKNFETDFWPEFSDCCSRSPRTNRVSTWKRDLQKLKKVFSKHKTNNEADEIPYFYKILKDTYGRRWISELK